MVRHVVGTNEVPHLWAHQAQSDARNGRNFSFHGECLYSYNTCIAKLFPQSEGEPVVLISERKYSVTTAGHISSAYWATSHMRCFRVPCVDPRDERDHAKNVKFFLDAYRESVSDACNVTCHNATVQPDARWIACEAAHAKIIAYCQAFCLSVPHVDLIGDELEIERNFDLYHSPAKQVEREKRAVKSAAQRERNQAIIDAWRDGTGDMPTNLSGLSRWERREVERALEERKACKAFAQWMMQDGSRPQAYLFSYGSDERRIIEEDVNAEHEAYRKEQEARQAANRDAWLNGASVSYHGTVNGFALCRVRGDTLETSQGANVPLEHAKRIARLAAACRAKGVEWTSPPERSERVGHYTLNRVATNGDITVGCHRIAFETIERLASSIGMALDESALLDA